MKKNEILGKLKEKAAVIAERVKQHPSPALISIFTDHPVGFSSKSTGANAPVLIFTSVFAVPS